MHDPVVQRLEHLEASIAATAAALDTLRALEADRGARERERRAEEQQLRAEEQQRRAEEQQRRAEEQQRRAEEQQRRAEEQAERDAQRDRERREWNREKGEIARKLGTLVEDMVSPSVPRLVSELFAVPEEAIERHGIRQKVRREGRGREFDVVTLFPGHALIVESKTQLRPEDVRAFVAALAEARSYLPEIGDRKVIGAVASLYLDDAVTRHALRQGLVVMGLGDHLMEAKCPPGFRAREF